MHETESAFIFINVEQAIGFGHIGWGFHLGADQYFFGSTDHLWNTRYSLWHVPELIRYMDVTPEENNDFWSGSGSFEEMMIDMRVGRHVRYHEYKVVPVASPNSETAVAFADSLKDRGWNILFNNCVHQTYSVLTRYGAELPDPYQLLNRFPKNWFADIPGEAVKLVPLPKRDDNQDQPNKQQDLLIHPADIDFGRRAS